MTIVCVDYMSRCDMRVSPPAKSFGVLHIYILCKVPLIFAPIFERFSELQLALNLACAEFSATPWGEGASRLDRSDQFAQKYALLPASDNTQACQISVFPDHGGSHPDMYRATSILTLFSRLLAADSEHNY